MGILFITHNLGVVADRSPGGRDVWRSHVETADVQSLFDRPSHPYTRGLLASMPVADHAARARGEVLRLKAIPGSVVDPRRPPAGCDFHPRCDHAVTACRLAVPAEGMVEPGHMTRCIRWAALDG